MGKFIITFTLVVYAFLGMYEVKQDHKITGTITDAENSSPLPGVNILAKGTSIGTTSDAKGNYEITIPQSNGVVVFSYIGYKTLEVKVNNRQVIDVKLTPDVQALQEVVTIHRARPMAKKFKNEEKAADAYMIMESEITMAAPTAPMGVMADEDRISHNTEEYEAVEENGFREALKNPLSTFSIDVDAASYSNMRRFLNQGQMPPKDAVRIEEMVNYFTYDYPQPTGKDPFSITTEMSDCPWNKNHRLVHIGLQGKEIPTQNLPPSNLVFLVDVSGSMDSPEKLPLLKSAFSMLLGQLRPQDRVAIVVYAGAAGLVLPSTSGSHKEEILDALDRLQAGGSTAGGAGIELAYKIAKENFIKEGNNRVILATDGDFNVGVSSNAAMERLIEQKRETGIFLTVLGFGMGNYKDSKMEILADKGNGNYAYIDNMMEARKVLVNEFGGTLFTIAKDVKIQVEFNPAKVKAYRLVGYENRALKNEDFNNDKKDAGELGAGHTVTALYELIPADATNTDQEVPGTDELKYQKNKIAPSAFTSKELMTLKLRYKQPDSETSQLLTKSLVNEPVALSKTSDNFRFSAAVAGFGMLLRNSEFKGQANYTDIVNLAEGAKGADKEGYRTEFINLVKSCQWITKK
ncbi:von Willebrand factor type A domain-containing protein [Rhodocytophaga aerolata]|uniref:von Willebrand factor type A domain-containing protein n=1 Tax=Rhodocytophaga aerolata TaxID=455078 RepID=A0ABT8RF64_9BACT|nr:von Willebrand factor type A domain-containing protein [Rhodocytophaga aerolata]MDO1450326.1 von Willebrand factor type A domain-containing protein [Rhodocytophaga aerolata]